MATIIKRLVPRDGVGDPGGPLERPARGAGEDGSAAAGESRGAGGRPCGERRGIRGHFLTAGPRGYPIDRVKVADVEAALRLRRDERSR